MMKQDSFSITNHPRSATVCGQCGLEERKFLHNVRYRGNFRRLCTSCVLRLHPQCFCPTCLTVYDRSPPIDAVVCYKCYSCSHANCISYPPARTGTIISSRCPDPCSSCLNPNLHVLNLNRLDNGGRAIDSNAANLLLAAAKIASMSMNKAEVAAALEAERRAKEAAYTKKRAREALDRVVSLMWKEMRTGNNKRVCSVSSSIVAMPPVALAVVMDANTDAYTVNHKLDASGEVLEALNAVGLKESGVQVPVIAVESVVSEAQGNGVLTMEVDVVNDKDLGGVSIAKNSSVKNDDLVKIVQNGQEQAMEKIHVMVETSVSNTKN